uniref:Uncharacterized protein MANES_15G095600 n=1 Tax=Rhizophora mucronata TaxID=61149 RepID=A0A2P2LXN1_RHIMU
MLSKIYVPSHFWQRVKLFDKILQLRNGLILYALQV